MGDVTVVRVDFLEVLHPLHDAPIGAKRRRLQRAKCRSKAVDEGAVSLEEERCLTGIRKELSEDLIIHGRARSDCYLLPLRGVVAILR